MTESLSHTQYITFKRAGRGESVLKKACVLHPSLCKDSDKIPASRTSSYILHLSDIYLRRAELGSLRNRPCGHLRTADVDHTEAISGDPEAGGHAEVQRRGGGKAGGGGRPVILNVEGDVLQSEGEGEGVRHHLVLAPFGQPEPSRPYGLAIPDTTII